MMRGGSFLNWLLVRVQIAKALPQAAAVVARGDFEEARGVHRGGDGGLGGAEDGVEVAAVDDDFHDRADVFGEFRFRPRILNKLRAEFFVSAGDRETVFAPRFR